MTPEERKAIENYYWHGSRREQAVGMFVIDPRRSKAIGYWDFVAGIALLFTATVTPYEVGFLQPVEPSARATDPLFLSNRVVDSIFVIDMLLQFLVAYQVQDPKTGHRWVLDARLIALHYLFSWWFLLDLFSISTSAFDIFDAGGSSNLFMLRALRALRLIKLIRLARGPRMLQRWEKRLSINYAYLGLLQSVLAIVISCHWFACIWGLQASFDRLGTWLGTFDYCRPLPSNGSAVPEAAMVALLAACPRGFECEFQSCGGGWCDGGTECQPPFTIYMVALYFAAVTTTSVGYGDVHATASNEFEQLICTLMVLFGGALWASLVGTFCGLAAQLDPDVRERRERLSVLNTFMANASLPSFLRFRLREFLFEADDIYRAGRARELLDQVSPALQGEVALTVSIHRLECVWYLTSAPTVLKIELASQLRPLLLPQGEQAPAGFMYVLERGTALYQGRVLKAPAVWGADILLQNPTLQLNFSAIAMSYCWVWVLDTDAFTRVFDEFAHHAGGLRQVRRRWRCRRNIVRAAERTLFGTGKSFHGRNYPLIWQAATRAKDAAAALEALESVGDLVGVSEDAPPDALQDAKPRTGFWRAARGRKGAAARAAADNNPAALRHQKLIENAARVFGAEKLKQVRMADKSKELQSRIKMEADVQQLTQAQAQMAAGVEALAANMRLVMDALKVQPLQRPQNNNQGLEA